MFEFVPKMPLFPVKKKQIILGKGNLIFCCTDLTDPKFWQIKTTMILISRIF